MDIKATLKSLSNACSIGHIDEAARLAYEFLAPISDAEKNGNTVIARLQKNKERTILIDAHIDEVGMIVTDIDDNGFITAGACGSIDLRILSSKPVTICGKEKLTGVFISTPPHLKKDDEAPDDITDMKIDTALSSKAKELINIGDYITYNARAFDMNGDFICGKSLDNRAGVVCVLELCERLQNKDLPVNVIFLLSDQEELGLRGVRTAGFSIDADEAVVIDVSFGSAPDISPLHCGKMGGGAMIGISPILNRAIKDSLHTVAADNSIPFQSEVMGGNTSTNADALSLIKDGIPTGLISVPLRNMHTDTEVVKISDIISVCDILEKYILGGGMND